jgi:DNA-binding transcriptional LysR family regulator
MQIESLKMFVDAVALSSFSRAAKVNGVSQSMISQAILNLEKRLGIELIDRTHRPWGLTEKGRLYFNDCKKIVEHYFDLENRIKGLADPIKTIIRVGAIYSVGLRHMDQHIKQFKEQNPQADIQLDYLHPQRVYEYVIDERIDLGIVSFPKTAKNLVIIPWQFEPMVLACHPDSVFADRKKIRPSALDAEKFVGFDRDLVIRREIDRYLKKHDASVEVDLEFDNIESIKRAVEIGSGVSILPVPTLDNEIRNGTIKAIPFTTKEFVRPLGIIQRRGRKQSELVKGFVDLLQKSKKNLL